MMAPMTAIAPQVKKAQVGETRKNVDMTTGINPHTVVKDFRRFVDNYCAQMALDGKKPIDLTILRIPGQGHPMAI